MNKKLLCLLVAIVLLYVLYETYDPAIEGFRGGRGRRRGGRGRRRGRGRHRRRHYGGVGRGHRNGSYIYPSATYWNNWWRPSRYYNWLPTYLYPSYWYGSYDNCDYNEGKCLYGNFCNSPYQNCCRYDFQCRL